MFERYSEKARRTIFFARYEASQYGSPEIQAEYILLALLREDKALTQRLLASPSAGVVIREEVDSRTIQRVKVPTSVDLPLSKECKRVLAYATEESERFGHHTIGCEHLLLGLLRENGGFTATLLNRHGVDLAKARKDLQEHGPARSGIGATSGRMAMPFGMSIPTLKVSDLEASVAFYQRLGFQNASTLLQSKVVLLTNGPFHMVLFHASAGDHLLCFVANFAEFTPQFEAAGLTVVQPLTAGEDGRRSMLLRDPDNNLVCLIGKAPAV